MDSSDNTTFKKIPMMHGNCRASVPCSAPRTDRQTQEEVNKLTRKSKVGNGNRDLFRLCLKSARRSVHCAGGCEGRGLGEGLLTWRLLSWVSPTLQSF